MQNNKKKNTFWRNSKGRIRFIWWLLLIALVVVIGKAIFSNLMASTEGDAIEGEMAADSLNKQLSSDSTNITGVVQKSVLGTSAKSKIAETSHKERERGIFMKNRPKAKEAVSGIDLHGVKTRFKLK